MNLGEAIKEINQLNKSIREKLESIEKFEKQYGKIILGDMLEEKKTLSDKITVVEAFPSGIEIVPKKDVKEALKEFLDCLTQGKAEFSKVRMKAKEIFGEELISKVWITK